MTILDFIFGVILLVVILIMFISWLSAKYDLVGKNEENKILREELKKQLEKEIKRKNRKRKVNYDKKSKM